MKNLENLTVSDYISMLRRRIWYVVAVTLLITIGTTAYVLQLHPTFTSDTTIFVFGRLVAENYVDSIVRDTNQDRIEFVRQQLQTRSFLERVVEEFQFAPAGANLDQVIQSVRARSVLTPLTNNSFQLSFTAGEPALAQAVTRRLAEKVIQLNDSFRKERAYGTDQFLDDQLRQAGEKLSTAEEKLRRFYALHFPGVPKDGVNLETVLTLQAQVASADSQLQNLEDRQKGLERRIDELRQLKTVAKASAPAPAPAPASAADRPTVVVQTALEQKLAARSADLRDASIKYTALHPAVIALTREVRDLEAQVSQERANARSNPPAPVDNNARPVNNNARSVPAIPLPEMDSADLALAELQLELDRVKRDIVTAEQAKKQAAAKLALNQSRFNPPAELAQELGTLNRELENARQQYTEVSSKKSRAGLASEADTSTGNEVFKIVDEASLPRQKNGPRRSMFVAGGFFVGLLLGCGVALGRELMDSSILDEAQATAELKFDVLASIPEIEIGRAEKIAKKDDAGRTLGIVPAPASREHFAQFHMRDAEARIREVVENPSIAGEQFRLLRSKLSAMQKTVGLKSLIVTSAVPDEGKTFSAACLAGIMAQDRGKKVLLIDADLRTGSAGRALGIFRNANGLTDLLSDGRSISETSGKLERMLEEMSSHYEFETNAATPLGVVQRNLITCSTNPNWYFLPAGAAPGNPADLLSSPGFEAIMRRVAEQFDWVIIDSPPVLAVADTNLLTPMCDATLFVLRAGKTSSSLVKDAVKRVGPERICGLVMNRVRNLKTNRYYSYYQSQVTTS